MLTGTRPKHGPSRIKITQNSSRLPGLTNKDVNLNHTCTKIETFEAYISETKAYLTKEQVKYPFFFRKATFH
jgi:hypothetical protein